MEIITFDHKVYQDLKDKIERIADYVFKKETNPAQEPEIWLTSDELADLRFHQEELFAAWEKAMEEQEQYEQGAAEE